MRAANVRSVVAVRRRSRLKVGRRPAIDDLPAPSEAISPEASTYSQSASDLLPPDGGVSSCIAVGQIMGAFGARGDLRVQAFSDRPNRFRSIRRVFIGQSLTPARVVSRVAQGAGLAVRLDVVTNREHARKLFGEMLYIPETEAVHLDKGEYFIHQLLGLGVVTSVGDELGSIVEVLRTGANDVYLVRGARGDVLIPAIPDVVTDVDLATKRVTITLMPGLID